MPAACPQVLPACRGSAFWITARFRKAARERVSAAAVAEAVGGGGGEVAGRASEESRSMVFYYAAAKGTYSSFLYVSEPVFFNKPEEVFLVKHYVIIGEKRIVDGWIDRVAEGL